MQSDVEIANGDTPIRESLWRSEVDSSNESSCNNPIMAWSMQDSESANVRQKPRGAVHGKACCSLLQSDILSTSRQSRASFPAASCALPVIVEYLVFPISPSFTRVLIHHGRQLGCPQGRNRTPLHPRQ
jgi:hypothetical protein